MSPTIAPPHPFDTATALIASGTGTRLGRTTAEYANMVGPFGGITAATLLRAALEHPDRIGEPVSFTVNFAGPITDGQFEVETTPVRTSRSTQHWTLALRQGGLTNATATAVFGVRRPSWADDELVAPAVQPAESVAPQELPDGIGWFRSYEMRFVEGGIDGMMASSGQADSKTSHWVRDQPRRPLDYPALTALADTFLPRVMLRLGRIVPAGTVSMTVNFHADADLIAKQGDRPVLGVARGHRFVGGFFDQSAELWGVGGSLLATSHQMVYFKA
ncbi:thioesterase family protein [Nocardia sp. NPDC049707]|uniref:acyl-CoA thioesterase n=1 Tax=Nocardia sp. NPDC049707 TaxID=3154735 RepID=UPI0034424E4E